MIRRPTSCIVPVVQHSQCTTAPLGSYTWTEGPALTCIDCMHEALKVLFDEYDLTQKGWNESFLKRKEEKDECLERAAKIAEELNCNGATCSHIAADIRTLKT